MNQAGPRWRRETALCGARHADGGRLVVITVGNPLRGDDGVARALVDSLPAAVQRRVCRFDLESYTGWLIEALRGHQAAIIVDSTQNNGEAGAATIVDLLPVIRKRCLDRLASCHALSIVDELQLADWRGLLPERVMFFGVQIEAAGWGEGLSDVLRQRLPLLAAELESLIEATLREMAACA